jgi:hypothetical protein
MTPVTCHLEETVLAAVASGEPRDQWTKELRAHTDTCAECAALASVALLLRTERDRAVTEADHLPSSGQVWWRTQVRRRAEARQAAERPMLIVQAVSAACLLGALAALLTWFWPSIRSAGGSVIGASPATFGVLAWLAIGATVVVAPVLLYLAVARE